MPITTTFEARYLDRAGLKALLDKLFPGSASFAVRGDWVEVTAPRELTEAERESVIDSE